MVKRESQDGFTLLELLIASLVFSVILVSTVTVVIQMSKLYFKAVTTNKVQETTRSVTDSIGQKLQFTPELVASSTRTIAGQTVSAYCIGTHRYSYVLNFQVDSNAGTFTADHKVRHALWQDDVASGCQPADLNLANPTTDPSAPGLANSGSEMLGQGMRLSKFSINCPGGGKLCTIEVGVLYGADDLVEPDPSSAVADHCQTIIGSQWCASANLYTTVERRL